jgi:hypothetical protein
MKCANCNIKTLMALRQGPIGTEMALMTQTGTTSKPSGDLHSANVGPL